MSFTTNIDESTDKTRKQRSGSYALTPQEKKEIKLINKFKGHKWSTKRQKYYSISR